MRRLGYLLALAGVLISCSEREPNRCAGTFVELEGVSILKLRASDDDLPRTLRFDMAEAEVVEASALLPGAPVEVYYTGRLSEGEIHAAMRIVVDDTYARLVGRWLERSEGDAQFDMGIGLEPGGHAYSIGMPSIAFERWELFPEGLLLGGTSFGGGNPLPFSEVWSIDRLTDDRLEISQPDLSLRFRRETEADIAAREAAIEAEKQRQEAERQKRKK